MRKAGRAQQAEAWSSRIPAAVNYIRFQTWADSNREKAVKTHAGNRPRLRRFGSHPGYPLTVLSSRRISPALREAGWISFDLRPLGQQCPSHTAC